MRARLAELQAALCHHQGNWVHPDDFHITLQFLGAVENAHQHCLSDAARRVRVPPFELTLDRLGYWARPRILWAAPHHTPTALDELAAQLGQALAPCGFEADSRPYRPHVTLLRKTTPLETQPLEPPIPWSVDHFVLVESKPHGQPPYYRPLEGWGLEE